MNVTSNGRPLGEFPGFKFRDGEGGFLCTLCRIDVSDVRNKMVAEAFYRPFFKRDARDGMETWRIGRLHIFIAPRSIQFHVEHQASEE